MGNGTEGNSDEQKAPVVRVPDFEDLRKRFFYHPPRDQKAVEAHEAVSHETFVLACLLTQICPPGRNLSLALTALEDVRMRANAAIAVDDPRP